MTSSTIPETEIELETELPEGAEVVVLTTDGEPPFELDDAQIAELQARMREADEGALVPAEEVLAQLRRAG